DADRDLTRLMQEHAHVGDALPNAAGIAQVLDALTPVPHRLFALVLYDDLLKDAPVIILAAADNPGELQHLAFAALDIDNSRIDNFGSVLALRHELERLAALFSLWIKVKAVAAHFPFQCWVRVSMLKSSGIGIFSAIPYRFFAAKAGRPSTNR